MSEIQTISSEEYKIENETFIVKLGVKNDFRTLLKLRIGVSF